MTDYLILIILHLIGDFYFQSTKVARCKNAKTGTICGTDGDCTLFRRGHLKDGLSKIKFIQNKGEKFL